MYVPLAFRETDLTKLHDLIERNSFGSLVSQVAGIPFASHLPFLLERESGPNGTLIGHTARANPQCGEANQQTVLAIFTGPQAYISPTWYEAENVVPTWNYVTVHAVGKMQIIEDEPTLMHIVQTTTAFYEKAMPRPWSFDASSMFAARMLTQIIGFRIEIETIEGKWKLSQNHAVERQEKVVMALRERRDENSQAVAAMMHERLMRTDAGRG